MFVSYVVLLFIQECPRQTDDVSCGVFVCCFADCISGNTDIHRYRYMTHGCISALSLLPPASASLPMPVSVSFLFSRPFSPYDL